MHTTRLSGWTPGQPTAVIDLGEEVAPDPLNASTAAVQFSAAYYAIDSSTQGNGSKKRKVERACDFCRKRKARCDGPQMPDNVCSNCITNNKTCTYLEGSKPRGPPKAYVVGLEDRVEKMEALLRRLRPELDLSVELGPPVIRDSWKHIKPTQPTSSSDNSHSDSLMVVADHSSSVSNNRSVPSARSIPSSLQNGGKTEPHTVSKGDKRRIRRVRRSQSHSDAFESLSDSSETDDLGELSVVRGMKRLTLRGLEPAEGSPERYLDDNQLRFHGKSSSFKLISATREFKQRHMFETSSSEGRQSQSPTDIQLSPEMSNKRPKFWTLPPWEKAFEHADDPNHLPDWLLLAFPAPDLAEQLIRDYFNYNNNIFPLLHRPTFEQQWRDKLHTQNAWFACVCLAIFGLGSRWSSDPRVLPDEIADKAADSGGGDDIWVLAGWRYIATGMKIYETRRSMLRPPELFEVLSFSLIGLYWRGTVSQHGSWFYLSVGVLKAQDIGAHRRKIYGRRPTVEEELWKRAYWHLVAFDRIGSMIIGRPCCSREEDLDLCLPLEVDDEYWENSDPEIAFQQPEGKPALVSGFVHWIKLTHVVAYALKTLYTPGKAKAALSLSVDEWNEQNIQKLNDALLKWLEELPPHLQWNPDMEDRTFATQAASLYTTYYLVQILIYRRFIRVPRKRSAQSAQPSALSHRAMSVCLNAARAAASILQVQTRRGMLNVTNVVHVAFVCAGVLLVHLWDLIRQHGMPRGTVPPDRRAQLSQEITTVMGEIGDLMIRLEEVSVRWELAREMLDEIRSALPDSPTEETSSNLSSEVHIATPSSYEPALDLAPDSPIVSPQPHGHPQVSPITPPDHYDSQLHDYVPSSQHGLTFPLIVEYAPTQGPMSFNLGGNVHQLWNMDEAPSSPPPPPSFNFLSSHPPSHDAPQRYGLAPSHPPSSPMYMPSQSVQHTASRYPLPPIVTSAHRTAAYHPLQPAPPQRHPVQTSHSRAYNNRDDRHHQHLSHQTYVPGSGPLPAPATPMGPYYNHESEGGPLNDRECLRQRLLQESYHNTPQPDSNGGEGLRYGPTHLHAQHSPDEWANGRQGWS